MHCQMLLNESGCQLVQAISGDHILWWQLPHNQGQGLQVQVYWSWNNKGTAGVGVFVAKEWIEKVSEVQN